MINLLTILLLNVTLLTGLSNKDAKQLRILGDSIIASSLDSNSFKDNESWVSFKSNVKASYYGGKHNGRKTASGEVFDENEMTCAHMKLKFGTMLRVTNRANGKSVIVRVTDRGAFSKYNRELDLSKGSMEILGGIHSGVISVDVEIMRK